MNRIIAPNCIQIIKEMSPSYYIRRIANKYLQSNQSNVSNTLENSEIPLGGEAGEGKGAKLQIFLKKKYA